MPFNPGSFTATQNAGPKPKVIAHDWITTAHTHGGFASDPAFTVKYSGTLSAPTASTTPKVTEGESAVATFWFVDPANSDPYDNWNQDIVELRDAATFNLSWAGTSSADVSGFQYSLFNRITNTWESWNTVAGGANNVDVSLPDLAPNDPLNGTKYGAVAVKLDIKNDTIVENGEQVHFKFTQNSSTVFTDSHYVEAKFDIVDFANQQSVDSNNTAINISNNGVQDVITLTNTSKVYDATATRDYVEIIGFNRNGDALKVDISPFGDNGTPGLSMVNFGILTDPVVNTEPELINGLRALNGLDCNQGGLYIMAVVSGASYDTFIIFDSNNNGKLDTNGNSVAAGADPADDVFVKLAGINPHDLQSTNFQLV